MSPGFRMDDYVDVAERIASFYDRFPDGRLTTGSLPHVVEIGGKPYIWYHARAYRTPDDPFPGDGWAAEPVPGATSFTKDSELMNAETAAWGRAIVALGFSTKKIASRQEVQNRQGQQTTGEVAAPSHVAEPRGAAAQEAPSPVGSAKEVKEDDHDTFAVWWDGHNLAALNDAITKMNAAQARQGLILEGEREMRGKGKPRKTVLSALSDRIRSLDGEPEAADTVSQATTEPDGMAGSDSEPASPPKELLLVKAALAWISDQPESVDNANAWTQTGILLGISQLPPENTHLGTYASLDEVPSETLQWIWESAVPDPVTDAVLRLGPEALEKLAGQAK